MKNISFWQWLRRPIWLPNISEEAYFKSLDQWNKEAGIETKVEVNITNNFLVLKNKKTGEIINLKKEDYEIWESKNEK